MLDDLLVLSIITIADRLPADEITPMRQQGSGKEKGPANRAS
jgi:hypothetical protein